MISKKVRGGHALWLTVVLVIFPTVWLRAQTACFWTNTVAASNWNSATNWSPNTVPNGIDNVVYFIGQSAAGITMDNGLTFTNGTFSSTNGVSWIIKAGTGTNYLQVSSGTPVLNVSSSGTTCWFESAYLAGTQGFNKTGAGKVTFRYDGNANTIAGPIGILGGTLGIQADYSLGNTNNPITITNGATLVEENGANSGVFSLAPSRTITLAGAQAQIAVNSSSSTLVIAGVINENPAGSGLLWNSLGTLVLSNANTFTGPLTVTAGTNDLANTNALQFSTLTVNGGVVLFDKAVAGKTFTCGGLAGTTDVALQNNDSSPSPITLTVGGNNASTVFAGNLTGAGSLIKTGTGTLALLGANTYTGATTISAGKLAITTTSLGAGPVSVADGANYNVQGVALNQTLTNSSLTLGTGNGATMEFNIVSPNLTAPIVRAANLTLRGTVKVNINGPAFAYFTGIIPLLAYGSKSVTGTGWSLGTLPAGMVASLNDTGSQLQLVISNSILSQTVLYTNGGNWSSGSGVDTGWTDKSVMLSSTNGFAGVADPTFWLPVNITNRDATTGVHCQVQLYQINHVFWNQATNQPLLNPYGRRFNFDVRFDNQYGNSTNGANEWDIDLLQFWQWSTIWTNNGVPQQWVNGQPEFMLWVNNNTYGRQYTFKIYTDVINATNNKAATEWLFQNTIDHPVTLEDGNWHSVSAYGSLSTGASNACVTVLIDGIAVNWDTLTKTVIDAQGNRGTAQVLPGPGTTITGCATLPDYGDFRARFGAYAYDKFGNITNFGEYLDDLAILTENVYSLPPVLAAITNRAVIAGATLSITNQASDPNVPAQPLGFILTTQPAGASINPTNGLITWRPLISQSGTSNLFAVIVTNTAGLAATQSFWVGVIAPQKPVVSTPQFTAGHFNLTINGDAGPDYTILGTTNLASPNWQPLSTNFAPVPPFQWTDTNATRQQFFYRVLLGP